MNLNMKKPCANCPFRKEGAIPLHPGRLEGIIADLAADDGKNFACHKTTHFSRKMRSSCMGSIAYMMRVGRPSLAVRFALTYDMLTLAQLEELFPELLEPGADGMPIYPTTSPESQP